MKLKLTIIAASLALGFAGAAQAQSSTNTGPSAARGDTARADRAQKRADEDRVKAEYKSDMAKCKPMKGNEKDLCEADAKGKEKVAKAELDAKYANTERNQRKVDEAKAEHEYHVAKEKCDAEKGKQENACEKEAKAKYDRAKADIKARYATKDRKAAATGGTK